MARASKFMSILPAIALIAFAGVAVSQNKVPAKPSLSKVQKQLIGTWRLVSFEDRKDEKDPNSEWTYPFGKSPKGYFVYDATGHVTIQIMRTPPSAKFASGDDDKPTSDEAKAAYEGYVAYFGTYTIDEANSTVIHHVEGSLRPNYAGTDQKRPFKLSGNSLIIGDEKTWRRVLERVR